MGFQIDEFINLRPFLYHLTAQENLVRLRACRAMVPAGELMKRAGQIDLLRVRRKGHEVIEVGGQRISLRDQKPLQSKNIALPKGYTFEDFVESLNSRSFFWPGKADWLVPSGAAHFKHYEKEAPVIIRVQTQSLIEANPHVVPLFCRCNSGATGCYGRKSPRGPDTFLSAAEFKGTASNVVEVTFDNEIALPVDTEYGRHPGGPWQRLK
jgi:hypothetical protein